MLKTHPARNAFADIAPALGTYTTDVTVRDVLGAAGTSKRDRSLIHLSGDVRARSIGTNEHCRFTSKSCRRNGVTREELIEVITIWAFYSGWARLMPRPFRIRAGLTGWSGECNNLATATHAGVRDWSSTRRYDRGGVSLVVACVDAFTGPIDELTASRSPSRCRRRTNRLGIMGAMSVVAASGTSSMQRTVAIRRRLWTAPHVPSSLLGPACDIVAQPQPHSRYDLCHCTHPAGFGKVPRFSRAASGITWPFYQNGSARDARRVCGRRLSGAAGLGSGRRFRCFPPV
jgi:4-carboxymuconolactone decarboxylase